MITRYSCVYDENDNLLSQAQDSDRFERPLPPKTQLYYGRREARRVATERGAIVYLYGDNGREAIEPRPSVGMAATLCYVTDRVACTVVAVSATRRKITVREDRATRTDANGMSECQSYEYEPDPNGREHTFFLRGERYADDGRSVVLGRRRSYHDYSY